MATSLSTVGCFPDTTTAVAKAPVQPSPPIYRPGDAAGPARSRPSDPGRVVTPLSAGPTGADTMRGLHAPPARLSPPHLGLWVTVREGAGLGRCDDVRTAQHGWARGVVPAVRCAIVVAAAETVFGEDDFDSDGVRVLYYVRCSYVQTWKLDGSLKVSNLGAGYGFSSLPSAIDLWRSRSKEALEDRDKTKGIDTEFCI